MVATRTTKRRNSNRTLGSPSPSLPIDRTALSSGGPSSASSQPTWTRRRGSRDQRVGRQVGRAAPCSTGSVEMMCTSIGPDERSTALITEPVASSAHRER